MICMYCVCVYVCVCVCVCVCVHHVISEIDLVVCFRVLLLVLFVVVLFPVVCLLF